ncbi:hypothetical protein Tco_0853550, partial [Tanacetum coccineum]
VSKEKVYIVRINGVNTAGQTAVSTVKGNGVTTVKASAGKRGRDTKIPQSSGPPIKVGDEAVYKKMGDRMERAATTASSFEAEQDSGSGPSAARHIFILLDEVTTVRLQVSTARPNLVLLVKSEGSEGFHEIIDFLTSSHIYYALTECPTLYISLIEQFWQTAALSTTEDGVHAITATIDGRDKIIRKPPF